jgi:dTMP kinase
MKPTTSTANAFDESGRFITLEGIDGAGKSTHIQHLAQRWGGQGKKVVCTREPGGTELAEALRHLILEKNMDALTEALLIFAARRDHLAQVIEPALSEGAWVLCDRFTDATFAYQGAGRGFDLKILSQLEQWVQGDRQPDLTILFEIDPALAAQRLKSARALDRFEQLTPAFFERVQQGYVLRRQACPARFLSVDAAPAIEVVWCILEAALTAKGW